MPRNRRRRWLLVAALCILGAAYEAWFVFVRPSPSVTIAGQHVRMVQEFGNGVEVSQSFQAIGNGLTAVEARFGTSEPATLLVECELLQIEQEPLQRLTPLRAWSATLKRISGVEWRRLTFAPIEDSHLKGFLIRMRLVAAASDAGERPVFRPLAQAGIRAAVAASTENVLGGGELLIARRHQVGSLSLRAYTAGATIYTRFRREVVPALPPALAALPVVISIAVCCQLALVLVVYGLLADEAAYEGD